MLNKNKIIRIALILSLIFSLSVLPNGIQRPLSIVGKAEAKELTEKKDIFTRQYKNADGSITEEIFLTPQYFRNGKGEMEDIDLNIKPASGGEFEYAVEKNVFKTYFNKHNSIDNGTIARFEIENRENKKRWVEYKLNGAAPSATSYKENKIVYENVAADVDLEYIVTNTMLKENFIVKNQKDSYRYTFSLNMDKSIKIEAAEGAIKFIDTETGEILWVIDKPCAEDSGEGSNKKRTEKVRYELGENNNISVVLEDSEFISSAKFPIIIDPTTTNISSIACCKTWGYGKYTDSVGSFSIVQNSYGMRYAGVKFNLDAIPEDAHIHSAMLNMYRDGYYYKDVSASGRFIEFYYLMSEWDDRTGMPQRGPKISEGSLEGENNSLFSYDITEAVKNWANGMENNGLMAKHKNIASYAKADTSFYNLSLKVIYTVPQVSTAIINDITACKSWGDDSLMPGAGDFRVHDEASPNRRLESAVRFNIDLPQNTVVQSAKLYLYQIKSYKNEYTGSSKCVVHFLNISSSWSNDSVYNPGLGTEIASYSYIGSNNKTYISIDVTSTVQGWVNGTIPNYGIYAYNAGVKDKGEAYCYFGGTKSGGCRPYLEIKYNSQPKLSIISPYASQLFNETDNTFKPSISVSDADGNTLTCKYYVDSEAAPRETKTVAGSAAAQNVLFTAPVNLSQLQGGKHTLKFEVSDGINTPAVSTIEINKLSYDIETSISSIKINGFKNTNASVLEACLFRYTVGSASTAWLPAKTYSAEQLTPNTLYPVVFQAKDAKGTIAAGTKNIYTKAQIPALKLDNAAPSSIDILLEDKNPAGTEYQIMADNNIYVSATGELSVTPAWISPANKRITITGLSTYTRYNFKAKAKNKAGIETVFSSPISGTTSLN